MSTEALIGLEAAMAELGTLYTTARGFTPLVAAAETEMLPRIAALGAQLRRWVRGRALDAAAIDAASLEVLQLRADWHARLEAVRASAEYAAARAAVAADRQDELAVAIPRLLAGLRAVAPVPPLFVPVSVSTGRRRPGTSPFLSPAEAAERISGLVREGIAASGAGAAAWEQDLPSVSCADDPSALETPVAVRVDAAALRATVFAVDGSPLYRVFTPRPLAAGPVWLAADPSDAWWEAYEVSYDVFRTTLGRELTARGVPVGQTDRPDQN